MDDTAVRRGAALCIRGGTLVGRCGGPNLGVAREDWPYRGAVRLCAGHDRPRAEGDQRFVSPCGQVARLCGRFIEPEGQVLDCAVRLPGCADHLPG